MASCVCAAYRTVSLDAATLLARMSQFDLLAMERKRVFDRSLGARISNTYTVEMGKEIRLEERSRLLDQWQERLSRPGAGSLDGVWHSFAL